LIHLELGSFNQPIDELPENLTYLDLPLFRKNTSFLCKLHKLTFLRIDRKQKSSIPAHLLPITTFA
jgi:hypothetical protein